MPVGVEVTVEDGTATVVFTDPALRSRGVGRLLRAARDSSLVQKVTHPVTAYVVPVEVARAAGMIDVPVPVAHAKQRPADSDAPPLPAPEQPPEPEPDMEWTRPALNDYAERLGIDAKKLPNKQAVLNAIREA